MRDDHLLSHIENRESLVQYVTRIAASERSPDRPWEPWMDTCVDEVVASFSESRLKTYVPLLALRHVRCCLRAGSCNCGEC